MKAEQKLNTFKSDVGVFFLDTCIENLRKSFYCSFSYKKQQQRNSSANFIWKCSETEIWTVPADPIITVGGKQQKVMVNNFCMNGL